MRYESGAAFRRALEDRLLDHSMQSGMPLARLRKTVAFDRLLARLALACPEGWILKGGLALQMKLGALSRTTKDIDVLLLMPGHEAHTALTRAARLDLGDWFEFALRSTGDLPVGAAPGGMRFSVTALLDGRVFESFHLDVGFGDPVVGPAERVAAPAVLAFAGIEPAMVPCYPLAQQLAEKLHAYVRRHAGGPPSRVKDLVDMVLIVSRADLHSGDVQEAVQATFAARGDQLPARFPEPPSGWAATFRRLAAEVSLGTESLTVGVSRARSFWEPLLQTTAHGAWDPVEQRWK